MTDLNNKYNLCTSGVHSYQVFTKVKNTLIYGVKVWDERLYYETELERERLEIRELLDWGDSHDEANAEITLKLKRNAYIYAINRDWNKELAHRLDLLLCSYLNKDGTTTKYIINDADKVCRLEAYQAIDRGTVDKDALLINDAQYFIQALGVDIYNECIAAITKN